MPEFIIEEQGPSLTLLANGRVLVKAREANADSEWTGWLIQTVLQSRGLTWAVFLRLASQYPGAVVAGAAGQKLTLNVEGREIAAARQSNRDSEWIGWLVEVNVSDRMTAWVVLDAIGEVIA